MLNQKSKIRVMIIDDSGFSRSILSKGLSNASDIEVIETFSNPIEAEKAVFQLKPDVLTLDVHMPLMNGIEFLRKIMPVNPIPVIMVSSSTEQSSKCTIDALMAGAVDYILKPKNGSYEKLNAWITELQHKIRMAANIDLKTRSNSLSFIKTRKTVLHKKVSNEIVIVIGASTGGVEAVTKIITNLPADCPGIVIVQHMPKEFTSMFAERLNGLTDHHVSEAVSGARILPGKILIAPGDQHVLIRKDGIGYVIKCTHAEKVLGHRPSVDLLFRSAAKYVRSKTIGILLTGMGNDGSQALLELKNVGAKTIIQDKESSVVFGMPGEAYKLRAAKCLTPLIEIPKLINKFIMEYDEPKIFC